MKNPLLILLLLFSVFSYSSEINGNVFLDNTSNHEGVLIKFNPVSTSAVYTETLSDLNGVYNITVVDGVYNITFEKNGYQTFTIENEFISTDITLSNVTLNSNPIIYISGNVSGTWTYGNTYIVTSDATIPENETLTIEAGVEIKFDDYFHLIVEGTLFAIGNEESYITFTSNKSNPTDDDWGGIQINNLTTYSELKYCIIEYGNKDNNDQTGLIQIKGNIIIDNSKIRFSEGVGVRISHNYSGDVTIKNSEIHNCKSAIYSSGIGELIVENNSIHDNSLFGIRCWPDSEYTSILHNKISQCFYGINLFSDLLIERNIFHNNTYGLLVTDGQPNIINNTFFSNQNGIAINSNDFYNPEPIINSNIFFNNSVLNINSLGEFKPSVVTYNLFYNEGDGEIGNNLPTGVGSIITTNINGVDSDTYFNIFSLPNLVSVDPSNEYFCELDSNSDAINAGDPNVLNNYNSTIIDIGAKESSETLSTNNFINSINFRVFPNPVLDKIQINAIHNNLFDKIIIHSIHGQTLKEYNLDSLTNEYSLIGLNSLESGIYIMSIYNHSKRIKLTRLIKK